MFWYHDELDRLEDLKKELTYTPELAFYGSSSFNYWNELSCIFQHYKPVNLAFGGSTLAACSWFFYKTFKGVKPKAIFLYAGDNDLGEGRHPEEVVLFFRTMLFQIRAEFGDIPVSFISIKPSPARWYLAGSIDYANKHIKSITKVDSNFHYINIYDVMLNDNGVPNPEYYLSDGLHLTSKGYQVWVDQIKKSKKSFPSNSSEEMVETGSCYVKRLS
ncbi:GDSL-type esterase/lipase family protein [Flavobacteriaceae bacterium]|nr:GDSL-type esterase/lipase family protein [Flavobacteriaceae bacterium]